jgi:hypothetical protein
MKSLARENIVLDSAASIRRNRSVNLNEAREEISALWQGLMLDIDYHAQMRTARSYEIAVEKLDRLRSLAIITSQTATFNHALSQFRERHQTKSMLISMLNRSSVDQIRCEQSVGCESSPAVAQSFRSKIHGETFA